MLDALAYHQSMADRTLNVPEGSKVLINVRCGSAPKDAVWKFVQDSLPTGKHKVRLCLRLL